MGERQVQHKERAIPQLSCALCRDRKLKCDKLDPCTNCTSSGVVCMPVYRPRLPRGRHARRSRKIPSQRSTTPPPSIKRRQDTIGPGSAASTSSPTDSAEHVATELGLGSRPGHCEAPVPGEDLPEIFGNASIGESKRDSKVVERIRRLECLVQKMGSCGHSRDCLNKSCESSRHQQMPLVAGGTRSLNTDPTELADAQLAAASLPSPSSGKQRELSVGSDHHESGFLAQSGPSGHFEAGFMSEDRGLGEYGALHICKAYDGDADADDLDQEGQGRDGLHCLNLLGLNSCLSINTPPGIPFGDRSIMSQLCGVYLRNVDPVIKILHRPSLSKWLMDGKTYLGYPDGHSSVQALKAAVCYAAANTLSEAQCQAMCHTSKSTIVSTYRRQCEVALERAGLLSTRCRIILQSFVLYLVGRRSEERSTAVWTLVALAVKITLAMGVNRGPSEGPAAETFFHQQMRLRLWLTICLLDLQAAFVQSTKPLISYQDVEAAVSKVCHVNDFDFDLATSEQVPDREELTETTFALVTYRAQVAGRLLNFPDSGKLDSMSMSMLSSAGDTSPSAWANLPDQQQRRNYFRQFQQQTLALLHFCNPESSSYAWFTWHSTQCIVSSVRLSFDYLSSQQMSGILSPVTPPSASSGSDTGLLRKSLQTLEEFQLMFSDPRGEGFRWFTVTVPWLALSTAIAECNTCNDIALVRQAWPIIEASYQQHAYFFGHCPLAMAMHQVHEKLSSRLPGGGLSEPGPGSAVSDYLTFKASSQPLTDGFSRGSPQSPVDPLLFVSYEPGLLSPSSQPSYQVQTPMFAQSKGSPFPSSFEYNMELEGGRSMSNPSQPIPPSELFDPRWMTGDVMTDYAHWDHKALPRNSYSGGDSKGENHTYCQSGF
ncbi:hypothetical protein E4U52_000482 [Claviceps spartinae]|nr:hypothetical protein E4U52_000482 [Claviceps spartinae]